MYPKFVYFCSPKIGELSSAGLEHLPYKQGVNGSSPLVPTVRGLEASFLLLQMPVHRFHALGNQPGIGLGEMPASEETFGS